MNNELFESLKLYFPFQESEIAEIIETGDYELTVKLEDGDAYLYNDIDNSIRRLPQDSKTMSEKEVRNEFGHRLRQIMYRKGITQYELSNMTGIRQASISDYITGKTAPSFYAVDKIAKALNCSTDEFRYIY